MGLHEAEDQAGGAALGSENVSGPLTGLNPWRCLSRVARTADVESYQFGKIKIVVGFLMIGGAIVTAVRGQPVIQVAVGAALGAVVLGWSFVAPTVEFVDVDAQDLRPGRWCPSAHINAGNVERTAWSWSLPVMEVRACFVHHGREGSYTQVGYSNGTMRTFPRGEHVLVASPRDLFRAFRRPPWTTPSAVAIDSDVYLLLDAVVGADGATEVDADLANRSGVPVRDLSRLVDVASDYGFAESRRLIARGRPTVVSITECGTVALLQYARDHGVELIDDAVKVVPMRIENNSGQVVVGSPGATVVGGERNSVFTAGNRDAVLVDALRQFAAGVRSGEITAADQLDQEQVDDDVSHLVAYADGGVDVDEESAIKAMRSTLRIVGGIAQGVVGNAAWSIINTWAGVGTRG